jgi:branched-chain amino acid transport system substrate-binding protein
MGSRSTFRLIANDSFNGSKLGGYAVNTLNAKTIAVIDDRTAYGQGLADQFVKGVKAAKPDIKILPRQFTNDKATDFNTILTIIKAGKPDIIFFGGEDAVGGPMLRQIKSLGIASKFLGGESICTKKIIELAGDALGNNKVYCTIAGGVQESGQKGMDQFKIAYKKRFGSEVQLFAPYTYDAVMILANAMQQAKSVNPDIYLPYLQKIHYNGLTGNIAFDDKGDLQNGTISLYTYQDGRRTQISVLQ